MILKKMTAYFLLLCSTLFLTACGANTVMDFKLIGSYPDIKWVNGEMLLSKDDKHLFVVNAKTPNQIDILDISNLTRPKLFKTIVVSDKKEKFISEYKLSKNKNYLYTANYIDGKILIYDVRNIDKIQKIKEVPIQRLASFVPNGKYLYVSGCVESKYCAFLNIYDLDKNKYVDRVNAKNSMHTLTISPNGKRLFYGTSIGESIGLADISNHLNIKVLDGTSKIFHNRGTPFTSASADDVVFSNDSSKIYIAGNEVGVMVYDISKNKLDNIQLTSGSHLGMLFNTTNGIYSLFLTKNTLYLAGAMDTEHAEPKYIKPVKGVNKTLLANGTKITAHKKNKFFVIVHRTNGLSFYSK